MRTITQNTIGGPDVLTVVDTDRPRPLPTEVLVQVRAIGVNPVDAMIRDGRFPLFGEPPFTLGWEFSGVVVEAPGGSERFRVGDEVYGMPFFPRRGNAYAEYVAAPTRTLARKPVSLDHVHAAALPLVGLTAWQGLVDYAGLRAGQRLLVHGAGGGVGHVAVQIGKALGAHVIGTASAGKHDFVKGLGADQVIDYRSVDFAAVVEPVDVVFDVIGGDYGPRSLPCLKPGGVFVTAVDHRNAALAAQYADAGLRFHGVAVEPDYPALGRLAELVDAGSLRPYVAHVLPLAEVAKAHELVEDGHTQGKIVLTTGLDD